MEITDLGAKQHIVLGMPWLKHHDPKVEWSPGSITFHKCPAAHFETGAGVIESQHEWIYSVLAFSPNGEVQNMALARDLHKVTSSDHSRSTTVEEDMKRFVPEKFWKYRRVFMKSSFDSLPPHTDYDHEINLRDDFVPQKSRLYRLSPLEQRELDKFLEENLTTGRIRPSKSPQAAPFFFTKKMPEANAPGADPGLRPIQDY